MEFIGQTIIPPNPEHLGLLKLLKVITLSVHLPYMGIVLGSSVLAVIFNILGADKKQTSCARTGFAFSIMAAYNKGTVFFLGIVPMVTLSLINHQLLYRSDASFLDYQIYACLPVVLGFWLMFIFKHSVRQGRPGRSFLGAGLGGLFFLLAGYFVFLAVETRLIDPEKWSFIDNPLELLLSWTVFIKAKLFMATAFIATGIAALFFFPRGYPDADPGKSEGSNFIIRFGAGLGLFFSLVAPLFWAWYLATLPEASISPATYFISAGAIICLLILSLLLLSILTSRRPARGAPAFVLVLLLFLGVILIDRNNLEVSSKERFARLEMTAAASREAEPSREAENITHEDLLKMGAGVFDDVCSLCHALDEEVLGPPLVKVVPKYFDDIEALLAFLKHPVAKNPDYPEMPDPGLETDEIEAVAHYLLEEVRNFQKNRKEQ